MQTALMWASHFGHEEVVKVLMAAGADVQAQNEVWPGLVLIDCEASFSST
jgi:ankyrin repeat protein